MHHAGAADRKARNFFRGQLGHVYGHEGRTEQIESIQARKRALTVFGHGLIHFVRGFVHVHVYRKVEFIVDRANLRERRIRHAVRRVRREGGAQEWIVAQAVVQFQTFLEIFLRRLRIVGGKVDQDETQAGAQASLAQHAGGILGKEIHIVEAGGAALQHLRRRQTHTIAHELRADPLGLGRPDVLGQPVRERQIIGQPAEQAHGRVCVGVDETRNKRVRRKFDNVARRVAAARRGAGQDGTNAPVANDKTVMIENHAGRFDWDDPAGMNQGICRFHGCQAVCYGGEYNELPGVAQAARIARKSLRQAPY